MSMPELLAQMELTLEPHVGAVTSVLSRPLLEVVLDEYFYEISLINRKTPVEIMAEHQVPSDISRKLAETIYRNVAQQITFALGVVYPSRHYSYELRQDTLVVVERRNSAFPAAVSEPDLMDDDDGSFLPERLRRS